MSSDTFNLFIASLCSYANCNNINCISSGISSELSSVEWWSMISTFVAVVVVLVFGTDLIRGALIWLHWPQLNYTRWSWYLLPSQHHLHHHHYHRHYHRSELMSYDRFSPNKTNQYIIVVFSQYCFGCCRLFKQECKMERMLIDLVGLLLDINYC